MGCGSSSPMAEPLGRGGATAAKAMDNKDQRIPGADQMKTQPTEPAQAAAEGMLLHQQPQGMFVPFDSLRNATEFPRRGSDMSQCPSYIRSYFTAATTLFIYLSHRWLEPSTAPPNPDRPGQGSPKLKLVVEACNRLLSALPSGFTVALWMDWMSLNQDGNPTEELGDSLQSIIGSCDLLLTPIHDPKYRQWSPPDTWTDFYEQYRAPGWQGSKSSYWERPWCRIEATFAAVTPLATEEQGWQEKRKALEGRPLGALMEAGRRPHLLFGTRELEEIQAPIFLPPMLHVQLEKYAAHKVLGNLTRPSDKGAIERFVAEAKLMRPKLEVGVVHLGGGRVRETYDEGHVYEGDWKDGKRNGRGKMVFANGEIYEGDFQDDNMHGHGKMVFAVGDIYEGEWIDGQCHGHGKMTLANGGVYEGDYKDDVMHGRGKFTSAAGEVYEGDWENDTMHGHGKYTFASGNAYEGEYKDDKKHGLGKKISPDGEVLYEGKWRNDKFVG